MIERVVYRQGHPRDVLTDGLDGLGAPDRRADPIAPAPPESRLGGVQPVESHL